MRQEAFCAYWQLFCRSAQYWGVLNDGASSCTLTSASLDMVTLASLLSHFGSAKAAVAFLTHTGVLAPPLQCPSCGQKAKWNLHCPLGTMPYFWCLGSVFDPETDRQKRCSKKTRWYESSSLLMTLPTLRPEVLLQVLYYFAQKTPIEKVVHEVGLSPSTVASVYNGLRGAIVDHLGKVEPQTRLGGPDSVVCVDETYVTRRKTNRGGFQGRKTKGHRTIIMGAVELNQKGQPRRETGRGFLSILANKEADTFEAALRPRLLPCSTVWTDGNPSYNWLNGCGEFVHETVIHNRGEFAKVNSVGTKVSTNAIEGVFARVKRLLRQYRASPRAKKDYGLFLAEFIWRLRFAGGPQWRRTSFWALLRALRIETSTIPEPMEFEGGDLVERLRKKDMEPPQKCKRGNFKRKRAEQARAAGPLLALCDRPWEEVVAPIPLPAEPGVLDPALDLSRSSGVFPFSTRAPGTGD